MSKTLADEIITIVRSEANNNPSPEKCTITKVYSDGYADVTFNDGSLNYVQVIGLAIVDDEAVLVWLDEAMTEYVIVADSIQTLDDLKDSNAYANLGTSANASQKQINTAINTKIGAIMTALGNCEDLIGG